MGALGNILAKLGIGAGEADAEDPVRERPAPAEMTLETKVPKEGNAIWSRFDSIEVNLESLTLQATDGSTETLTLAGGFDLREEEQTDGDPAVYQLEAPPATYEAGEFSMNVRNYRLQEGEPELPLEGFEEATLDFGGSRFEPGSGEEWTLTIVFEARENDTGDAYVLDPGLEWRQSS